MKIVGFAAEDISKGGLVVAVVNPDTGVVTFRKATLEDMESAPFIQVKAQIANEAKIMSLEAQKAARECKC